MCTKYMQIGAVKGKKRGSHKLAEMITNDLLLEERVRALCKHEAYQPQGIEDTHEGRKFRRDPYGRGPSPRDLERRLLGKSGQHRLHDVEAADIKKALVELLQGKDLAKGSWPRDATGRWSVDAVAGADVFMHSYASLTKCQKPRLEAASKAKHPIDNSWFTVSMPRSEVCCRGLQIPPDQIADEENASRTQFPRNLAHLKKDFNDITCGEPVGLHLQRTKFTVYLSIHEFITLRITFIIRGCILLPH